MRIDIDTADFIDTLHDDFQQDLPLINFWYSHREDKEYLGGALRFLNVGIKANIATFKIEAEAKYLEYLINNN